MKRAAAFILSLVYIAFTVGVTIHQHYCMGELVGKSLFSFQNQECGKCGMTKHTAETKDCCRDVSVVLKSNEAHTYSQIHFDLPNADIVFIEPPVMIESVAFLSATNHTASHPPNGPPGYKGPLYIQFQNFRI